jgi:predicted extracellular nuclease
VLQARALRRFAADVQARSGVDETLLVGDFNAYPHEDPIATLTHGSQGSRGSQGAPVRAGGRPERQPAFIDEIARFDPSGYSFVFDGAAGRLDEVLASPSLSPRVTGVAEWHVNADEPSLLDYTLAFRAPSCAASAACAPDRYAPTPYRASDHDPVVMGLKLAR